MARVHVNAVDFENVSDFVDKDAGCSLDAVVTGNGVHVVAVETIDVQDVRVGKHGFNVDTVRFNYYVVHIRFGSYNKSTFDVGYMVHDS